MDKKSKVLFFVLSFLLAVSIVISFYKIFVLKDYFIKTETACDPVSERCFVRQCDPEIDSTCPVDEAERTSYYKVIEKKANTFPMCDPASPDCPAVACEAGQECQETFCDEETVVEGESCNDPAEYLKQQEESAAMEVQPAEDQSMETQPAETRSTDDCAEEDGGCAVYPGVNQ